MWCQCHSSKNVSWLLLWWKVVLTDHQSCFNDPVYLIGAHRCCIILMFVVINPSFVFCIVLAVLSVNILLGDITFIINVEARSSQLYKRQYHNTTHQHHQQGVSTPKCKPWYLKHQSSVIKHISESNTSTLLWNHTHTTLNMTPPQLASNSWNVWWRSTVWTWQVWTPSQGFLRYTWILESCSQRRIHTCTLRDTLELLCIPSKAKRLNERTYYFCTIHLIQDTPFYHTWFLLTQVLPASCHATTHNDSDFRQHWTGYSCTPHRLYSKWRAGTMVHLFPGFTFIPVTCRMHGNTWQTQKKTKRHPASVTQWVRNAFCFLLKAKKIYQLTFH